MVRFSKSGGGCKASIKEPSFACNSVFSVSKRNPKRSRRFLFLSRLAALLSFSPPPHTVNTSNVRRHVILSIPFGMKATPEP
ncbi:hypothetical protein NC651_029154 [Populus alba x Populus x berolinensis]|nr:hypothetical protein NC651_029154 [Populus alba x Populus x berolinensis]